MLDGIFRNEMNDGDRPGLVLAPGAGDALFEPGRVPGEVAVDDDAGVLQVKPGAAGIGAQEDAAARVVFEAWISARRRSCGTDPVWQA